MKKIIVLFALIVVVAASASAMGMLFLGRVRGSGNMETESYDERNFQSVRAENAIEVVIEQGEDFSIEVEADDNVMRYVEVDTRGDVLRIGLDDSRSYWNTTVTARIVMPEIEGLVLSGACQGTLTGFFDQKDVEIELSGASDLDLVLSCQELTLDLSGASTLDGEIECENLHASASGASDIELEGGAEETVVVLSGASTADLADFTVLQMELTASGASDADVSVEDSFAYDLSGASSVVYRGEPEFLRSSVTGASSIRLDD